MANNLSRADLALLMRAAFSRGEEAREAWEQFSARRDIDDLYLRASAIMPALYLNLEREGIRGEGMDKIKGYYRYTWCRNQLAFVKLDALLGRLASENVCPIATGALGTLLTLGLTRAETPLESLDLLVAARDKEKADRIARDLEPFFGKRGKDPMPVIVEAPWSGKEEEWRESAVLAQVGQSKLLVPRIEDLLLDSLMRAQRTSGYSSLIEAVLLLAARGNIVDWNVFEASLAPRMSILAARRSLKSLSGLGFGLVPEHVLESVSRLRPHPFERLPDGIANVAWRVFTPIRRTASRVAAALYLGSRARP